MYLERELRVEVSGPQKLDEKAVGESRDSGQLAGLQGCPPQAAHMWPELLRVVREFAELRPVHVAPRSGYISFPRPAAEKGEETGCKWTGGGVCVCVCV